MSCRTALVIVAITVSAQATVAQGAMGVDEVLNEPVFCSQTPAELSPDGGFVAYGLQRARTVDRGSGGNLYFTRTGMTTHLVGCDVWVAPVHAGVGGRGGEARSLTQGKGTSWGGSWSPNGKYLAFYSDRDGLAHLWIWDRERDRLTRASSAVVHPFFGYELPRWLPDGERLIVKLLPEGVSLDEAIRRAEPSVVAGDHAPRETGKPLVTLYVTPEPAKGVPVTESTTARYGHFRADLGLVHWRSGAVTRLIHDVPFAAYFLSPRADVVAIMQFVSTFPRSSLPVFELDVIDIPSGRLSRLASRIPQKMGLGVSWSPDGSRIAYFEALPRVRGEALVSTSSVHVVNLGSGGDRDMPVPAEAAIVADLAPPFWDADGEHIYLLGRDALWRGSASAGALERAASAVGREWTSIVGSASLGRVWQPNAERAVYVRTFDASTKRVGVTRIDVASGSTTPVYEADEAYRDAAPYIYGFDSAFSQVAYRRESGAEPSDVWVATTGFTQRRRVTTTQPSLAGRRLGETRVIAWQGPNGDTLRGALMLPAEYSPGTRYPLVVDIYGAARRSNDAFRFHLSFAIDNAQLLATRGYAVLAPDAPITANPMVDIAKAVLPGVDKAVELGIADPGRLGIMGVSYGCYSTLAMLVQTTRFRAAVCGAGIADLVGAYGHLTRSGFSRGVELAETGQARIGRSLWEARDRYIENSPLYFFDRVTTPVLIVHGTEDDGVPIYLSDQMFVALRRLGKTATYARYTGMGHDPLEGDVPNARDYLERVLRWFDDYLGTEPRKLTAPGRP